MDILMLTVFRRSSWMAVAPLYLFAQNVRILTKMALRDKLLLWSLSSNGDVGMEVTRDGKAGSTGGAPEGQKEDSNQGCCRDDLADESPARPGLRHLTSLDFRRYLLGPTLLCALRLALAKCPRLGGKARQG